MRAFLTARTAAYTFRERWHLAATPEAVHALLVDLELYPDWWPQVLAVAKLGDDDARVLCRSVLPYTLDLVLHAESRSADLLETSVSGDLEGVVRFQLAPEGAGTRVDFEQDVVVRGWLAAATRWVRPVLAWNHQRMMAGCREGLARRLREA